MVSLDFLARIVPSLKVVHVYRDGHDEAVSAWEFNSGLSRGKFREQYPKFGDFAKTFAGNRSKSITAARRFERDHPGQCFHFRAEAAWEAVQLDVDPGDWKHTFEAAEKRFFNRQCGELLKLLG